MMTTKQLRWLLLAIASGLLTFVAVRRRRQIADALPQPLLDQAERFVIPWPTLQRTDADTSSAQADTSDVSGDDEEPENGESMQRKVSSGGRISFGGKRYGPLPESLVGEYVEVETRDNALFILHDGTPIANFELQS